MQKIILDFKSTYKTSPRYLKTQITKDLIQVVRDSGPDGEQVRFLKQLNPKIKDTSWVEATDDDIFNKISHGLRSSYPLSKTTPPATHDSGELGPGKPATPKHRNNVFRWTLTQRTSNNGSIDFGLNAFSALLRDSSMRMAFLGEALWKKGDSSLGKQHKQPHGGCQRVAPNNSLDSPGTDSSSSVDTLLDFPLDDPGPPPPPSIFEDEDHLDSTKTIWI
jgi:hypothetical protein